MTRRELMLEKLASNHPALRRETWSNQVWAEQNRDHLRTYRREWERRNGSRRFSCRLKALKSGDSMFNAFSSLDACTGYESRVMIDRITPLDELIMKEEGLL